jgi:hypothetical protein
MMIANEKEMDSDKMLNPLVSIHHPGSKWLFEAV